MMLYTAADYSYQKTSYGFIVMSNSVVKM